jgi:hypothetical protein
MSMLEVPPFSVPGSSILNRYAATAKASREVQGRVQNACGHCGATSYKTLMARNEVGVMQPSGRYQCVQCRRVFSAVAQWRDGAGTPFKGH